MKKTKVGIRAIDPLVPLLSEDERLAVARSLADGTFEVEMDEERYRELWCRSHFVNARTVLRTEDAMRRGVKNQDGGRTGKHTTP